LHPAFAAGDTAGHPDAKEPAVRSLSLLLVLLLGASCAAAGDADDADRLRWFREAKLGIFIHWGIYAVDGIDESWSFHNGHVTHDGVALWDSEWADLTVVAHTPAGRDLIAPYVSALRGAGLRVGLYYSLIDWSSGDYPGFLRERPRYQHDPERWARFSEANHGQIRELSRRFQPDLVWFDGDWEHTAEEWDAAGIRAMLLADNPQVVINVRLQGHGDYATPEQGVPIARPDAPVWELCLTMNDSWGYQPRDRNYKTVNQIIRILVECLDLGGNLLLDIGPLMLKGITSEVAAITVVGDGTTLDWDVKMKLSWSEKPGVIYIDVPEDVLDPEVTVVAVRMRGEVGVYGE
jgi:alpha-L-fucosidase